MNCVLKSLRERFSKHTNTVNIAYVSPCKSFAMMSDPSESQLPRVIVPRHRAAGTRPVNREVDSAWAAK